MTAPYLLDDVHKTIFPDAELALTEPDGLLAVGGDLSVERLTSAYQQGIFPWYSEGQPILWWSPDPRCVIDPSTFVPSRSLAKRIRKADFEVRTMCRSVQIEITNNAFLTAFMSD